MSGVRWDPIVGFGIQGLQFRVRTQGSWFGVEGLRLRAEGLGLRFEA